MHCDVACSHEGYNAVTCARDLFSKHHQQRKRVLAAAKEGKVCVCKTQRSNKGKFFFIIHACAN